MYHTSARPILTESDGLSAELIVTPDDAGNDEDVEEGTLEVVTGDDELHTDDLGPEGVLAEQGGGQGVDDPQSPHSEHRQYHRDDVDVQRGVVSLGR